MGIDLEKETGIMYLSHAIDLRRRQRNLWEMVNSLLSSEEITLRVLDLLMALRLFILQQGSFGLMPILMQTINNLPWLEISMEVQWLTSQVLHLIPRNLSYLLSISSTLVLDSGSQKRCSFLLIARSLGTNQSSALLNASPRSKRR